MHAPRPESDQRSEDFEFELSGGSLCLDFVNTLGDRPRNRSEHLRTYGDLVAWSRQTEVLAGLVANRLAKVARENPPAAKAALTKARELRESLYGIIAAFAAGKEAPSREVTSLNRLIAQMMGGSELVPTERGFRLARRGDAEALDQMLWSVVHSALELLVSDRMRDIRQCAGKNCSWLFLDNSRTRRRKWCDMKVCGNRAKARRHYKKTKALVKG